jgi:hypothetical protein
MFYIQKDSRLDDQISSTYNKLAVNTVNELSFFQSNGNSVKTVERFVNVLIERKMIFNFPPVSSVTVRGRSYYIFDNIENVYAILKPQLWEKIHIPEDKIISKLSRNKDMISHIWSYGYDYNKLKDYSKSAGPYKEFYRFINEYLTEDIFNKVRDRILAMKTLEK